MKAQNLSREELLDRLEKGLNSMEKRFSEIEESDYRLHKDATRKFRDVTKDLPKDLNELDTSKLRTLYRDLLYINSLKTATLEGAEEAKKMYKDIEDIIENFSEDIKKKFWDLYDKLYDENKNVGSAMYKYDVLRELATRINQSNNAEKTIEDLEENMLEVIELISGERDINIHEELEKLIGAKREISLDRNMIMKEPFNWFF